MNHTVTFNVYFSSTLAQALAPSKPQNVQVGYNPSNQAVVTWAANVEPDVTTGGGYDVYRAVYWGSTLSYTKINTALVTSTTFSDSPPVPTGAPFGADVWCRYQVKAKDSQNKYSLPSEAFWLYGGKAVSGTVPTATWNGQYIATGSLTVNSGQTLTLSAGTKIAFAGGTSLTVSGTLTAIGTGVSPIVCDRFGPSGIWAGIVINGGGVGNIQYCNISHATPAIHLNGVTSAQTVKNCNIANCTNYGIRVSNSNSSYKDISYNTIDNVAYAIYLNNASAAIDHNTINNTSYQTAYGIYSYGGGGSECITNNTITAYDAPVYADYYSTLLLLNATYGTGGHNKAQTGSVTLLAGYNSVIEAGGYGGIQGLNSFYGGGIDPQVVATGYSTVVARNNWWGDDGYSESRDQTSTIEYDLISAMIPTAAWERYRRPSPLVAARRYRPRRPARIRILRFLIPP